MPIFISALLILSGIIWSLTSGIHLYASLALSGICIALAVTVFLLGLHRYKSAAPAQTFVFKNIAPFHGFGPFGWMLVLMALLAALSLIPLPLGLLDLLSPKASELYRNTWALAGIERNWGYLTASCEATAFSLWILLGFLGIYLTALRLGATRRNSMQLMHALALSGLVLTAMFAFKFAGHPISFGPTGPNALFHIGLPLNSNHSAGVFTFLSITALGNCLSKCHKDTFSRRLLWFMLYLVFGVLVFMLKSRGAILAWFLGQACFGIIAFAIRKQLKKGQLIFLGIGTVAVLATVLALSASTVSQIRTEFENTSISFEYTEPVTPASTSAKSALSKTQMYADFLKMSSEWGRAGTGRSAFIDIYPAYQGFPFPKTFRHAENEYWEILLEYGWFWGAVCLILGAAAIFLFIRDYAHAQDERESMTGLLAAVLALLMQNMFDFNLRYWTVGLLFCIACGTLEARRNRWRYGKITHDNSTPSRCSKIEYLSGAAIYTISFAIALTALPAAFNSQTGRAQSKVIEVLSNNHISPQELPQLLEKPLTYHPTDQAVRSAVASAYIRKGTTAPTPEERTEAWTLARRWLESSLKIEPHHAKFALRLAKCNLALNDQKAAADLFLKAVSEDPRLTSTAMYEMSALSDANIRPPQSFSAMRALLGALLSRNRVEAAHSLLLKNKLSDTPVQYTALSCIFLRHIDMDEACHDMIETLDDQPLTTQLLTLKASTLTQNKQYHDLLKLYEDAEPKLKNDPEYWRLRLHASVYYGTFNGDEWYKTQIPKLQHTYRKYAGISTLYAVSGHICDARYALNIKQYGHAIRSAKLALALRPGQQEAQKILKAATEAQKRR